MDSDEEQSHSLSLPEDVVTNLDKLLECLSNANADQQAAIWAKINQAYPGKVPANGEPPSKVFATSEPTNGGRSFYRPGVVPENGEPPNNDLYEETGRHGYLKLEPEMPSLFSNLRLTGVSKLTKYKKGENFDRFCERFQEHVTLMRIQNDDLYLYFLQHVDDSTYSMLKPVSLTGSEKRNPKLFCDKYTEIIYGEESVALKNELINCKQAVDEDVTTFACKLREKANIAFADKDMANENCLLAFTRGVREKYIKRKLNEANLKDLNKAIKLAKRLEKVEEMLNEETHLNPILKAATNTSTVKFEENSTADISELEFRQPVALAESSKKATGRRDGRADSRQEGHRSRFDNYRSRSWDERSQSRSRSRDGNALDRSQFKSPQPERRESWGRNRSESPYSTRNRSSNGMGNQNFNYRPRGNFNFGNSRGTRSREPGGAKVCYFCQKSGHIQRNCWKKRNWISRNQGPQSHSERSERFQAQGQYLN